MGDEERRAAIAEAERALADLREAMVQAIRDRDGDLYVTLANRYGQLHQRWERLQRPQVGFATIREGLRQADEVVRALEEARKPPPDWRDFRVTI